MLVLRSPNLSLKILVSEDLGSLAREAVLGPGGDVGIPRRPEEPQEQQAPRSMDTGMGTAMDGVEGILMELDRKQEAGGTCMYVGS